MTHAVYYELIFYPGNGQKTWNTEQVNFYDLYIKLDPEDPQSNILSFKEIIVHAYRFDSVLLVS